MENIFFTEKKQFLIFFTFVSIFCLSVIFIEDQLFFFINETLSGSTLDFIFFYIFIPLFLLLGIIPFLMLFSRHYRRLGIFCMFSGFFCSQIGSLIKLYFQLPRPVETLAVNLVGNWQVSEFSFPSTTTMLAFGLALPILLEKPKYSFYFLAIAALVGFSVIYSGYHFPHDVAAGILLSLAFVIFLKYIKNWLEKII
ncbi:MAG: phosphatase PAP2 family protein [bacterium]